MVAFRLNGEDVDLDVPNDSTLLYVLAFDANALGPKYGCGKSQCGSCTVLIDGDPVRSCDVTVSAAAGRQVTTLAGLREADGGPGPLQRAMIEEQAAQCGYCTAGAIMQAQALLDRNPNPTESEVRSGLNEILCRCGSHNRIVRAVLRAAEEI
ncbi:(2Fe-2S)-binding protein [Alkalilacustris brevis]|uniref:(2Fe-2S)-binding protein n=1 Tax=Alkalilacustris brevis TaxID=2026338 RepID=UPI000E0D44EA|nr:(2Fe-2S)-binding protein [Alkalilacustris brevis]